MALSIMANGGGLITAKRDGAMYDTFALKKDYVLQGIGREFECTAVNGTLIVTMAEGQGVLCGRHVYEVSENGSNTYFQLPANDNGYLVIRLDLTRPAGSEVYLEATPTLYRDDINSNGTVCDLPLYRFVTGVSSVTSLTDVRNIKEGR